MASIKHRYIKDISLSIKLTSMFCDGEGRQMNYYNAIHLSIFYGVDARPYMDSGWRRVQKIEYKEHQYLYRLIGALNRDCAKGRLPQELNH